jgi:peptide/nickel transport system permease protein
VGEGAVDIETGLADDGVPGLGELSERGRGERGRRLPLTRLILRRCLYAAVILWVVTLLVFFATQGLPGDTARAILGQNATDEQVQLIREQLGLNRSIPVQYLSWIGGIFKGDLGKSLANRQPVSTYLHPRVLNTLTLMLIAVLFSMPLALFVGILCAVRRNGFLDRLVSGVALVMTATPPFVVGLALILLVATSVVHWLPPVSLIDSTQSIWGQLKLVLLPAVTLAIGVFPYVTYMIRGAMIEALDSPYVSQARLNGIPEWRVILRHGLPNVVAPTAQVVALQVGYLAGGAVAVETVFSYPGIGLALFSAIQYRDLPVAQILTVSIAGVYVVATLVADVIAVLVTPRVRTGLR